MEPWNQRQPISMISIFQENRGFFLAEQDWVKEVERGVKVKVKKNFERGIMVSFQRMKEDFDDISTQVGKTNKNKT